jgi:AcrR family transcriptional regulator
VIEVARMPAVTRTPRAAWIAAGLRTIATEGPRAIRVEKLAAELGVTKGGFYGYFADRAAFMQELLGEWERRSTDDVLRRVEAKGGDAAAKIRRAGALTFSADLLPIDLAIRAWARYDTDVAARLRRVDNKRIDYLRSLFGTFISDPDEVEARSVLAFSLVIGQHLLATDHGGRSRTEAVALAGTLLLATPHV